MHTYESGHSTASKCVHSFLEVSKLFSIWITFPVNFIHFFGKKSLATFLVSTLSNPLGSGILQWQRISYLLSKVIQSFRLWATKSAACLSLISYFYLCTILFTEMGTTPCPVFSFATWNHWSQTTFLQNPDYYFFSMWVKNIAWGQSKKPTLACSLFLCCS